MVVSSDAEMVSALERGDIDHVLVEFPDINGLSRSKQVSTEYFLDRWRQGFSMNLVLLANTPMTDIPPESAFGAAISYADGTVHPIPSTFKRVPWRDGVARVLCEFTHGGDPVGAYSRTVLDRVLDRDDHGLTFSTGSELEFYLLDVTDDGYRPATSHKHEYVSWATEEVSEFYDRVVDWGVAYDVEPTSIQHEHAPGQLEILFEYGSPMDQADVTFDFKRLVDAAARRGGQRATFMARPFANQSSSGYHLHVGARDDDGENAFDGGDGRLSRTGRHFVGGLLEHADALVALGSPNLNSFKRLRVGGFVPSVACWGYDNRLVAIRVPAHGTVRIENRLPDAGANPYLVIAATLAAGIHGISEELDPGEPVQGEPDESHPPLPPTPEVALRALESDRILTDALGREFVREYCCVKRAELDAFDRVVTDWERSQYVETL